MFLPFLGGLLALGGSIFSGMSAAGATRDTNEANKDLSIEQMKFQERMSNTAHQRQVADMQAAGLNPVLSASGGSGASAPGGASATMQSTDPNGYMGKAIQSGIGSALELASVQSALKKQEAETGKTAAETMNTIQQGKAIAETVRGQRLANAKSEAENPLTLKQQMSRTDRERIEAMKAAIDTQRASTAKQKERAEAEYAKVRAKSDKENLWWDKKSEQAGQFLDNITSGLNVFKLFQKPKPKPGAHPYNGAKGMDVKFNRQTGRYE